MTQTGTRQRRSSRRARCRRSCAPEKRCTGIFGARTGHRSYSPDSGRWLNRDPIGEKGGSNVNGACYNDLIRRYDPDGRHPLVIVIGGAITITAADAAAAIFGLTVIGCLSHPDCRAMALDIARDASGSSAICRIRHRPRRNRCRLARNYVRPEQGDPSDLNGRYRPAVRVCIYICDNGNYMHRTFPPSSSCSQNIRQPRPWPR